MQKRAVRLALFGLLFGIAIGGGILVWSVEGRVRALDASERSVTSELDQIIARLAAVTAAQAGYVAPGQPADEWLDRVEAALTQIAADAATLQPRTRSVEAAPRLKALSESLTRLGEVDLAAREALFGEDAITASQLVFGESRGLVDSMIMSLRHLRDAESNAFLMERETVVERSWMALGIAALVWIIGLALLARVPAPREAAAPLEPSAPLAVAAVSAEEAPPAPAMVDIGAAADICTAISRVTSEQALHDLLGRAAALLDATGVIVWMSAGEELFAVTAYGYDARVIAHLGPIGLSATNATATAWRTGEMRTVAGDDTTNGAIIAPMFGASGCIGVVTAEVRHGREQDPATRAAAALIAAQLSSAVAAWPAPSASQSKVG
jgi:hypothetical protein